MSEKRLVYLANVPWRSFSQRAHMFVRWIHDQYGAQVLWVDPYPIRFPRLSDWRRLQKLASKEQEVQPSWLEVVKTTSLPLEPMLGSQYINSVFWRPLHRKIDAFIKKGDALIAIGKPSAFALQLLGHHEHTPFLYDAMDDVPEFFTGRAREAARWRESEIALRVDRIWVSSHTLQKKFSHHAAKTDLVLNACADDSLPQLPQSTVNRDVSPSSPVLGYVGAMAQWFDWDWVIKLAHKCPQARIRLIGPLVTSPSQPMPGNIEILPACEHRDALNHMRNFDVGLIPFQINELTEAVDPIKYYEYRAMGLPVITSRFGQMRRRTSDKHIFFAEQDAAFDTIVKQALACRVEHRHVQEFREIHTWRRRFNSTNLIFA